ncbi:MAG: hypothetical protein QOJ93_3311 [Actinomycetota bacterium]|nr:hypothetical protein [Actinomycetota bacterium]
MSIRATEGGGPPWGTTGLPEPEPKRRNVKLIVLAAVLAVIVALGALAVTGVVHVPFIGSNTVTEGDPVFGWTITIPTKWTAKGQALTSSTVRFQAEGSGVGIRVQAQRFPQEIPADQVRTDTVVNQLKVIVNKHGPDVTIREGPTFGTIRGVPYVRYVYTFTDSSSGVPVPLQDADYYLFNGAKLEEVTFETTAARYASVLPDINKAIQTFRSQHFTAGASPSVTATATSGPPGH